jgi:hypothetical protein
MGREQRERVEEEGFVFVGSDEQFWYNSEEEKL